LIGTPTNAHTYIVCSKTFKNAPTCFIALIKPFSLFNNVILARNRQLPDDDGMIETCWSIFKRFNVNNLSVCIGWCADQVILRSARCNGKDS